MWRSLICTCALALFLLSPAPTVAATRDTAVAASNNTDHTNPGFHSPLQQQELSRFLHDLPFFLRWARGQGLSFQIYPKPQTLFAPQQAETSRKALHSAGWEPERFAFLLCATGAAATACAPDCGRPLTAQERSLLEAHMHQLMDAYGTGP